MAEPQKVSTQDTTESSSKSSEVNDLINRILQSQRNPALAARLPKLEAEKFELSTIPSTLLSVEAIWDKLGVKLERQVPMSLVTPAFTTRTNVCHSPKEDTSFDYDSLRSFDYSNRSFRPTSIRDRSFREPVQKKREAIVFGREDFHRLSPSVQDYAEKQGATQIYVYLDGANLFVSCNHQGSSQDARFGGSPRDLVPGTAQERLAIVRKEYDQVLARARPGNRVYLDSGDFNKLGTDAAKALSEIGAKSIDIDPDDSTETVTITFNEEEISLTPDNCPDLEVDEIQLTSPVSFDVSHSGRQIQISNIKGVYVDVGWLAAYPRTVKMAPDGSADVVAERFYKDWSFSHDFGSQAYQGMKGKIGELEQFRSDRRLSAVARAKSDYLRKHPELAAALAQQQEKPAPSTAQLAAKPAEKPLPKEAAGGAGSTAATASGGKWLSGTFGAIMGAFPGPKEK